MAATNPAPGRVHLDLEPLGWLHRSQTERASVCTMLPGLGVKNVCSLSREQFSDLPFSHEQAETLVYDSFVTINSVRPTTGLCRTRGFRNLPSGTRRDESVSVLNACWVDIDPYKAGVTVDEALAAARSLVDTGRMPPWSLEIFSGGGVWLLFLLEPTPASPVANAQHNKINRHLAALLRDVGGDDKSVTLSRITRLPSTRNSKYPHGPVVTWTVVDDECTYSLGELSRFFPFSNTDFGRVRRRPTRRELGKGVGFKATRAQSDRARMKPRGRPFTKDKATRAAAVRWAKPLADLLKLSELRGGFRKGHRHCALMWAAYLLRFSLEREPGKARLIRQRVEALNQACPSPLSRKEVDKQLNAGCKVGLNKPMAPLSNAKLSQLLAVTAAEAEQLQVLKPEGWVSPAKKQQAARLEASRERQQMMVELLERWAAVGHVPSPHELNDAMNWSGYPESVSTTKRTWVALGGCHVA